MNTGTTRPAIAVALLLAANVALAQQWHAGDTLNTSQSDTSRIDPLRDNALDLTGKDLVDAEFPKSWPIFGTEARMSIGGYVKLDYNQDLDGGYDRFQYEIHDVPIPGDGRMEQDGYMNLHVRESRFNFDIRSITETGMPIRVYLEMDFYNLDRGPFNQVPRLRHAYGVLGRLLVGRTWGTQTDVFSMPATIDFAAGDALSGTRRAQLRFEDAINDRTNYAFALEMMEFPEIDAQGLAGQASQELPIVVGRLTHKLKNGGRMMFGASAYQLRWDGTDSVPNATAPAWGLSFSGREFFGNQHSFRWLASYGQGFASNVVALIGQGGAALMTPEGDLVTMPVWNLSGGFAFTLSPVLVANLNTAWFGLEADERRGPSEIQSGGSAHVNLIWSPYKAVNTGIEFMLLERRNGDDASGQGRRIQLMVKYVF